MHLTEQAKSKRDRGQKKSQIHESWGYTETSQAAPCEEIEGEGTKNMAVRNSTYSLTSWSPDHCVVNTE